MVLSKYGIKKVHMTRETSIEAFRQIEAEGLLTKLKLRVLRLLVENGPLTAREAYTLEMKKTGKHIHDNFHQRFSELQRLGVVDCLPKRICRSSGRNAFEWKYNGGIPNKKKLSNKKQMCLFCNGTGFSDNGNESNS